MERCIIMPVAKPTPPTALSSQLFASEPNTLPSCERLDLKGYKGKTLFIAHFRSNLKTAMSRVKRRTGDGSASNGRGLVYQELREESSRGSRELSRKEASSTSSSLDFDVHSKRFYTVSPLIQYKEHANLPTVEDLCGNLRDMVTGNKDNRVKRVTTMVLPDVGRSTLLLL
ncbi:hypothetical protein HZH66_002509 [Vespula vulgaris]|uniref:Uncharacterized protein n=1 Tax=Vespula vulgaris TaxID=7454 RepID=A0A834NG16_VESVU|nr:hypothetical protein HZH66_002509 [Vespula vulgaris]